MRCRFSQWTFDFENYQLYLEGQPVAVRPKTLKLLSYFLLNPYRLISREEILDKIWTGRCVNDEALTTCIKEIRQILGDSKRVKKFILTRYGLGYQFTQPVIIESQIKTEKKKYNLFVASEQKIM